MAPVQMMGGGNPYAQQMMYAQQQYAQQMAYNPYAGQMAPQGGVPGYNPAAANFVPQAAQQPQGTSWPKKLRLRPCPVPQLTRLRLCSRPQDGVEGACAEEACDYGSRLQAGGRSRTGRQGDQEEGGGEEGGACTGSIQGCG